MGEMEFCDLGQFSTDGFTLRRTLARDYDALVWISEVQPATFTPGTVAPYAPTLAARARMSFAIDAVTTLSSAKK